MLWGIVRAQAGVHCIGGGIAGNSCSLTSTPLVLVSLVHYSHLQTTSSQSPLPSGEHITSDLLMVFQWLSNHFQASVSITFMEIYVIFFIIISFNSFVSMLPEIGKQMYVLRVPCKIPESSGSSNSHKHKYINTPSLDFDIKMMTRGFEGGHDCKLVKFGHDPSS